MEGLTIEHARAFYDTWYHPNNAILIVAGDVTPEEVLALAEEHYGPIPASDTLPPRLRPTEPPHIADRRVDYADERVANPYVSIQMLAPVREPGDQAEAAALVFLAELLGGGSQTSLFARRLQVEEETLRSKTRRCSTIPPASTGRASPWSMFRARHLAGRGRGRSVAHGRNIPVRVDRPRSFCRIRFRIEANEIFAEDDTQGLARSYGVDLTSGLTLADAEGWTDVLAAVTPEDRMAGPRGGSSAIRRKETGQPDAPAPASETSLEGQPMIARLAAALTALSLALPAWATIEIEEIVSPGGIEAWLVEDPSIPFVALEFWFRRRQFAGILWTSGGRPF